MTTKNFNVKNGLTTGNITLDAATGNITGISNANLGNTVTANYFSGSGNLLANLQGSNVSGEVGSANIAWRVSNSSQPNITSVGTLTSLAVTGNVTAGNVSTGIVTANVITTNGSGGNITGVNYANANYFVGDGGLLSNIAGGNVTGQVANALVAGTVYTAAQPNITSVGTLTNLVVSNGTAYSNVNGNGTIQTSGNITAQYFIGNVVGNISGTITVPGNNTAVLFNQSGNAGASDALKFDYSANVLTVIGNVNATRFIGNGALLTDITGANVTGYVPLATAANTATSATTAGTVTTAAQPNITSVGTLSSLTVSGLITATSGGIKVGNLQDPSGTNTISLASGNVSMIGNLTVGTGGTGNVTANYFIGNGSQLTSITGGNVTGQVGNALLAGTVYTNAQPNITSVGTLTSLNVGGNLDITGNINVTGNLNYSNVSDLVVGDPLIYIGANNTGNLYDLGIVASYNDGSYYHTGIARNHSDGTWTVFDRVVAEPTTTIDWANATMGTFKVGNLTAGNVSGGNLVSANFFSGNGSALSSITGANVTGTVSSATTAGTVTTAAQPNITSVGTLTSLTISGNLTAGNVSGGNLVSANYVSGNGSLLTSITGANVTGQVGNALVAGTVYTNAQPNITSVGTLSGLTATGTINLTGASNVSLGPVANVHISGGSSGYLLTTDGSGTLSWAAPASTTSIINGTSNVNIASSGGNVTTSVGGTANVLVVSSGGADITGNLTISGNLTTGNITTSGSGGNITGVNYANANYFSGNGSFLTGLNASNLASGTISSGILGNSTLYIGTTSIALNRSSGSQSLTGVNIDGSAGSATTAGTVTTAAQPNITSVGTLTSLTVSGNITADNVAGGNLVSANYISGNGSLLTSITGANVTGYVPLATAANTATSATTAGTVTTAAQPNITSVGTLSSLTVSGNITAGNVAGGNLVSANYISGNGSLLTSITGANITGYVPLATAANTAGTVTTAAQPNITSVGTLTSLTVSGNATVGNAVITGGILSNRANVSVSTNTVIDEFSPSSYRTAKYVVSASSTNGYQSAEIILVQDGTNSYISIYGSICSNSIADIVDFSSNINGISGNVAVYATGTGVTLNLVATYLKT